MDGGGRKHSPFVDLLYVYRDVCGGGGGAEHSTGFKLNNVISESILCERTNGGTTTTAAFLLK